MTCKFSCQIANRSFILREPRKKLDQPRINSWENLNGPLILSKMVNKHLCRPMDPPSNLRMYYKKTCPYKYPKSTDLSSLAPGKETSYKIRVPLPVGIMDQMTKKIFTEAPPARFRVSLAEWLRSRGRHLLRYPLNFLSLISEQPTR